MDYGKSFSYPLEDNDWPTKLGIGVLVSVVPILNFAATGYMVQVTRNVINQQPDLLPDWDNFGQKFIDGLIIVVVSFIYSLPFFLLWLVASGFLLIPALGGENEELVSALAGLSMTALCGMGCLSIFYILIMSFILPAITIFYARERTFSACLRVGEILGFVTSNFGNYLGAVLVLFVGAIVLAIIFGIVQVPLSLIPICGNIVGIVITWALVFYVQIVAAHLFGQVGSEAVFA
jgi:hypothetical protein